MQSKWHWAETESIWLLHLMFPCAGHVCPISQCNGWCEFNRLKWWGEQRVPLFLWGLSLQILLVSSALPSYKLNLLCCSSSSCAWVPTGLRYLWTSNFCRLEEEPGQISLKSAQFFPRPGLLEARCWTLVWPGVAILLVDFRSRACSVVCLSSHSCRFGVPHSLLNRTNTSLVGNQKFLLC